MVVAVDAGDTGKERLLVRVEGGERSACAPIHSVQIVSTRVSQNRKLRDSSNAVLSFSFQIPNRPVAISAQHLGVAAEVGRARLVYELHDGGCIFAETRNTLAVGGAHFETEKAEKETKIDVSKT